MKPEIRAAAVAFAVLLLAPMLSALPARAASPAPVAIRADDTAIAAFFDAFLVEQRDEMRIPGAAIVVVRDGRTVFAKGYGVADVASGEPINVERTLFRAASISKLLPWVLAMQLVEQGRLDLDADVNDYLDFRIAPSHGRPITMRHLMTHTAGFPERFHGVFDPDLATPLGRKLADNLPERTHPPGAVVAYSNYGAALAGYIVERRHGEPWERIVEEQVFAPLAMRHSTVAQPVPPAMQASLASTYHYGNPAPAPFRTTPLVPMGALTASAADMGRLLALFVDGARGIDGIVSAATLRRMMTLEQPLGPALADGMGLGLLVGDYRGVRYAGHAGNMEALATDLEVLPAHGIGWYYVFTSQGAYEDARAVREKLLHAFVDRFAAPLRPLPEAADATVASTAAEVAGIYLSTRRIHRGPLMFSGLMNTTDVVAEADGSLRIESSGKRTHWIPVAPDRFVDRATGIGLSATRDADGIVQGIGSAALYPAAVFERRPPWVAAVPALAAFSFGTVLLAALVRPAVWLVETWRSRRAGKAAPPVPASARRARVAFWLLFATLLGWGGVGLSLAIDFGSLFTLPALVRLPLAAMTLASAPLAALLVFDAARRWRDPIHGGRRRFGATLVAAAAIGTAALLYGLQLWRFTPTW